MSDSQIASPGPNPGGNEGPGPIPHGPGGLGLGHTPAGRPPRRPLVEVALAAVAGALAGGGSPGFGIATLALLVRCESLRRMEWRLALMFVFGLSVGRAALGSEADPAAGARWRVQSERSDEVRGTLDSGGRGEPATFPIGTAAEGELVRVLASSERRRAARGPVGEPRALPREPLADEIVRLAPGAVPSSSWSLLASGLAQRVDEQVGPTRRPFVRALLFGRTNELDWETRDLFVRTGSRHLLAVSGLHVVLFGSLVAGPLARLVSLLSTARSSAPLEALLKALFLVLYVPFAGGGAPVTRAACALALTWIAPSVSGRRADGRSVLALAALVELGLDPRAPLDVGVQLSYAATFALVTLYGGVRARLASSLKVLVPSSTDRVGRPRVRSHAMVVAVLRGLTCGWAAAIVASGATLPIIWVWFGEWSPLEIAVAPLTVPLLAGWLAAAWAELLGWPLPEPWLDAPRELLFGLLRLLDQLPGTPLLLPERPAWLLALLAWLVVRGLAREARTPAVRSDPSPSIGVRVAWVLAGLVVLPWKAGPRGLEIVALDVGHGTAVLVRAPGQPVWIFDAGSRDRTGVARDALLPLLRSWDAAPPIVCLSHDDRDHHSALEWVVQRIEPRRWIGADLPDAPRPQRLDLESGRVELASRGPARFQLSRGTNAEGNEGSRTLSIEGPEGWVHLCGDAEEEGLSAVLDRGHLCGPARLLLFPHHGSMGTHVSRLLETLRPTEIWISSSQRPAIADELDRRGLPWRSTASAGPLALHSIGPERR